MEGPHRAFSPSDSCAVCHSQMDLIRQWMRDVSLLVPTEEDVLKALLQGRTEAGEKRFQQTRSLPR